MADSWSVSTVSSSPQKKQTNCVALCLVYFLEVPKLGVTVFHRMSSVFDLLNFALQDLCHLVKSVLK